MEIVISPWILPEAMVISGTIGAGAVGVIDYGLTGSVDPKQKMIKRRRPSER